jgi:hypothetical protein
LAAGRPAASIGAPRFRRPLEKAIRTVTGEQRHTLLLLGTREERFPFGAGGPACPAYFAENSMSTPDAKRAVTWRPARA